MALFFFSQLIGKPILDSRQEKVAVLKDVIVRINPSQGKSEETYPPLAGLLAPIGGRVLWIPVEQVARFEERSMQLSSAQVSLERFVRRDGEILLGQDVLDKQLVDVEGRRVIRVNDLALGQVPGEQALRLLAVDISFQALSRRILPLGKRLSTPELQRHENLLDWADVQYFASSAPAVQLNISHDRLGKLHPADLARLLDELSYVQRAEVVGALPDQQAADALEAMTSDDAADILEGMQEGRAADLLEEMRPDVAADVVADLDQQKADRLLNLMDHTESQELQELLAYDEDTAGGIMTNEFLLLPDHLEVAEALRTIRSMPEQPEFVDYIYVAEPGTEHLLGVASLRDVVFCLDRTARLRDLMVHDVVAVHPETSAKEAAALLAEYDLRALAVVEEEDNIIGIITFDDALAVLLPPELRERIPLPHPFKRRHALPDFNPLSES